MGSTNSRIEASPPVRRKKLLRIASFLCGAGAGAGAADGDTAAGSTAIETQVHESQDRNQVATNFTKSSIKELENSHSERATTSNSSNFQTGDLQSDDISEPTPIQEHSDTTIINTEFEATSSDTGETSNNSNINNNNNSNGNGRSIWEAISRPGSRRNNESSEGDEVAFYDRWLDLGDEIFGDTIGDELRFSRRRRHASSALNWHSRSLIRERNRVGSSDRRRNNSNNNNSPFCPSGLHPDGTCACNVFSSAEASISRIVMLTEALFEVLDEIHRHPTSLSLSSTSHQAPESVVNSLPSKSHKKSDKTRSNDEVEQCYICLTEYEDGEQIRVLPCNHEFHMSCVDKWLKEVHRVCPLCRGDVCENTSEILSSN